MNKLIQRYPYKKTFYFNWYQAAIGHLLLFKYHIEQSQQNVYFLISQQGIILKATSTDYLKKVQDQINKFFTAKIQELELNGSSQFYNNIIENIQQLTDKLKQDRDCPYINLVYSQKLKNSCQAMKKHGYSKPFENWQCKQRQKKGFCFLIVRPDHRWKQIANHIYQIAKKIHSSHSKTTSQIAWPVQICYEKFLWFFLKKSFTLFKKSIQIKQNKTQHYLTILIKNNIPQLTDLQKQIQSLTFSYRPTKPLPKQPLLQMKILVLSPLDIDRIIQLIYHQFGLTNFGKQLKKAIKNKYLVIGSVDINQYLEDTGENLVVKNIFNLHQKQHIQWIRNKQLTNFQLKMGRRHTIVQYNTTNYIQLKIQKPLKQNYQKILKLRLPSLPIYYFWYENDKNYFLLRNYFYEKFVTKFSKLHAFVQISTLYSVISIVDKLHKLGITVGSAIPDCIFIDEQRVLLQPDQNGNKQQDISRLKKFLDQYIPQIKQQKIKNKMLEILSQVRGNPFQLIQFIQDYILANQ